jgi:hypothetical protein
VANGLLDLPVGQAPCQPCNIVSFIVALTLSIYRARQKPHL